MCLFLQAAYLIGVADPHSEAAVPGLVDQEQFLRAQQAIVSACENLSHPSVTQEKVCELEVIHGGTSIYILSLFTDIFQCCGLFIQVL